MSEHSQESTETTEPVGSLEDALAKNYAALSGETESTDSTPPVESGDDTSIEAEAETEAEQVQESEDSLEPLEKWTDEQKETFKALDRGAQQFLLDRHKDVESYLTKETQSLSETKKRYERLDEVLKPYDEALRQRGIEIAPHMANALQYYFAYQQDPASTIKALIQNAGLDQGQVFEDESVDPDIRALRTELHNTRRELAQLKSQPSSEDTSAQRELDAFRSATQEDGTPKYPHFDKLRALMAPLVADGKSLEDAYNESLWTLPEHRQAQMEAERKKTQDELAKARQQKADKAKKAADVLPSSDVESAPIPPKAGNWEAALKHTLSNME